MTKRDAARRGEATPALGERIARARDDLVRRVIERLADGYLSADDPELLEEGMVDHVVGAMAALSRPRRERLEAELTELARAIPRELLEARAASLVTQLRIGAEMLLQMASADDQVLEAFAEAFA